MLFDTKVYMNDRVADHMAKIADALSHKLGGSHSMTRKYALSAAKHWLKARAWSAADSAINVMAGGVIGFLVARIVG